MDEIAELAGKLKLDCEFKWVPGYLHGKLGEDDKNDRETLEEDATLAQELGFDAEFVDRVPYAHRPGVRFPNQAKFHPLKYLGPLLQAIHGDGSYVFENTESSQVESDPLTVQAGQYKIKCEYLVIATHTPLIGKSSMTSATLFQSKLALYTSYVLGAKLPRGLAPEALFWDTTDPYYYLRIERFADYDYAIFGGEDVKTGQEKNPEEVFARLQQRLVKFVPGAEVQHRWLGQVVETNDGLPFIGENEGKQFIEIGRAHV